MPGRHRDTASSTEGVVSDDGINSARGALNLGQDRSNRSLVNIGVGDDNESMFMNAQTETGSTQAFVPIASNPKSKGSSSLFSGLSKSASKLLSEDDQTLNELLTVDVHVESIIDVEETNLNTISNSTQEPNNAALNIASTNHDRYLYRIRELEAKLEQKEKEISLNDMRWEQKVKEQQKKLEDKFASQENALKKEILAMKGLVNERNDVRNVPELQEVNPDLVNSRVASLTADQIARYSRQLLLSEGWGVAGQQTLLSSSVLGKILFVPFILFIHQLTWHLHGHHWFCLVIGAGGIGSTLLLYLASSGVGNITVVDFDNVEMSNLHRQVIHTNAGVGMNKAVSACQAMKKLNPTINCTAIKEMLTFENAMDLVARHDCVVDACDNPQTRYLVNDACILNGKPLVSGSAMGTEGQLTVYGYKDSACYRCLYPRVNPTEGGKSCSDNGVLGPVPGLIGILQAIETLKVLTGTGSTMHDRLLMYDSLRCSFMNIKKGKKRSNCAICGPEPSISNMADSKSVSSLARGPQQCGMPPNNTLPPEMNISCRDYYQLCLDKTPHVLLDLRVHRQYELCSLQGSVNIELSSLENEIDALKGLSGGGSKAVYCLCRRGIASAEAAKILSSKLSTKVYNIKGGLNSWVTDVDPSFPMY